MPQSAHRFALATIFSAIAAIAPASDLGDRLDREIRGAWGILEVEVYSSCAGTYNDNTIGASGVASKAGRRFEPRGAPQCFVQHLSQSSVEGPSESLARRI